VRFVLDASVAMRWALLDGLSQDREYADNILASLADSRAVVPPLWHIEIVSVLRNAEKHGAITEADATGFLQRAARLPINTDDAQPVTTRLAIAAIARQHRLTGHDATYLELALRESIPLATLDVELIRAAKAAGVVLKAQARDEDRT
jgi:predicted nucleic acid-binding protein